LNAKSETNPDPDPNPSSLFLQGGPKSKPLPNYQTIVLNHIKACQLDYIYSS